ncbi:MAG: regulatory protein RecX [Fusobacteriaceae bacterium]|jgi:regulatory protein|nr:regulatory protein RecX [Fusobacteriaceae bacterium]MBP6322938.1 regulatory protein RecX [Fusobacteriaceae bacterium]MBP9510018.1 regulatory protein RecX [Fusobacteriaceae bacterium]
MINFILIKNKIKIEDKKEFSLSKEIISEYSLKDKESLTQDEYKELIYRVVYNYSIYLLSKKDYFQKDLFTKLKNIFHDQEIINTVLEKLEGKGYLDDFSLVEQYIKNHEKYGRKKIEYELNKKGISNSKIKELLDNNIENEFKEIEKVIEKLKDKPLDKIITALMRKGFEYKSIKSVLDRRKEC